MTFAASKPSRPRSASQYNLIQDVSSCQMCGWLLKRRSPGKRTKALDGAPRSLTPVLDKLPEGSAGIALSGQNRKLINAEECLIQRGKRIVDQRLISQRFRLSSQYHPEWVIGNASGGANALWLTEWLAEALDLRSGIRVLDLGCGCAASSIFLHREFGVQVWATDLWFSVSENLQRIRDAGVEAGVFPIHAEARSLPFATDFFDAIVSIDSFVYYGTDDLYLNYLARFVKPGGLLGIAGAGLMREIEGSIPEHLREWWEPSLWCLHSAAWWRRHWERTGIMNIELADTMPDGWHAWLDWQRVVCPENSIEIKTVEADRGSYLGYVRIVGRRRAEARLEEPIVSVPTQYTKKPLLRSEEQ
jgi:SAM-dependent methyltransferase